MQDSLFLNIEILCKSISLGNLKSKPKQIYGGLLHKMFMVEAAKGRFAVKALNQKIMLRDTALKNFNFSEKVANIAFKNGINTLPAIEVEGNSIFEVGGQFYLVFPWIDGKTVTPNSVDINNSLIIGKLLANIHNLDFSSISNKESDIDSVSVDWNSYLEIAKAQNAEWFNIYSKIISKLYRLQEEANKSNKILSGNLVISHRDLDQKNVLWDRNNSPMIIDWESAGYTNPSSELLDVALYWSGGEIGVPDKQAFTNVVKSYYENGGKHKDNLIDVFNASFSGKLGWLAYNIKRSLRTECSDDEEQVLGTNEVIDTLKSIKHKINITNTLLKWLS